MGFVEAIIALCFLIFFHELGHFSAAKIFGVRVETFSIGFGPKLITKTIANTQYALSLIPLGGYVKLKVQNDLNPLESNPDSDSYTSKKTWQKIIILFAGVFFNFILAFGLYGIVGFMGVKTLLPTIGEVSANSPAQLAGIQKGDIIISINNRQIKSWEDLNKAILESQTTRVDSSMAGAESKINAESKTAHTDSKPNSSLDSIDSGFAESKIIESKKSSVDSHIDSSNPASSLTLDSASGFTSDSIASDSARHFLDSASLLESTPLALTLKRGTEIIHTTITPKLMKATSIFNETIYRPMIGVRSNGDIGVLHFRGFELLEYAFCETKKSASLIFQGLQKLIIGVVPLEQVGGVVGIVNVMADIAPSGMSAFLLLVALISVNLAVLNLLPIPALDGGQILFCLYEGIMRKPISQKMLYRLSAAGFGILIFLMILGTYNDIIRLMR